MTTVTGTQSDLFAWAKDLERESKRIAEINAQRVRNRGYLAFATDPSKGVDSAEYQQVYATEAPLPSSNVPVHRRGLIEELEVRLVAKEP